MRKLLAIIITDVQMYLSEIGNLVGLLVLPVGMTLLLGFAFTGVADEPSSIRADLIDQDNTPQSAQMIETLKQVNERLVLCPSDASQENVNCALSDEAELTVEAARERVRNNTSRALIVIPAGYGAAIQQGSEVTVDYYTLSELSGGIDPVRTALDAVVQRSNSSVIAAEVALDAAQRVDNDTFSARENPEQARNTFRDATRKRAQELLAQTPADVQFTTADTAADDSQVSGITQGFGQSVPGQGTMFVMFTVLSGMGLLIKERRQWTLQRLVVMPVSRAQILGGKLGAYFVLGMLQYVIVFVIGGLVGMDFGDSPFGLLLMMTSFVAATTALTLLLATVVTSEGQAGSLTTLLALTLAPLGGAWWPIEITPEFMQTAGHISPVAWAMDGFRQIIFFGAGIMDVLPYAGVLLAFAAVCFVIGVRRFRYEM